jgi:hypothetical protein
VVHLTRKRLLPAAEALRDFLVAEAHTFLPVQPRHADRKPRKRK